jgi:hypothetical protein
VIQAGGNEPTVFLNGAKVVRFQVVTGAAAAIDAISLNLALINTLSVPNVLAAASVAYIIRVIVTSYGMLHEIAAAQVSRS